MSILTIAFSTAAAACLTLGLVYAMVWLRARRGTWSLPYLWFGLAAAGAAGNALAELAGLHAETVDQFVRVLKLTHVPITLLVVSISWFVVTYFRAGRRWLAWAVTGIWIVVLAVNLASPSSIVYREVSAIRVVPLPWGETFAVAVGTPNPWVLLPNATMAGLLFLVADASWAIWRRGDRRRAAVIGGSILTFFGAAFTHSILVDSGVLTSPYLVTFAFLGVIVAMAFELGTDVLRASVLSRAVQANERRWHALLDQAHLSIAGLDRDGRIDYANPAFSRVAGARAEALIGRPLVELVDPDDRPAFERLFRAGLGGELRPPVEVRLRAEQGDTRTVQWSSVLLRDAEGLVTGVLGIGTDVTEQRKAEASRDRALRETTEALGEAAELRQRLEAEVVYLADEIAAAGHFEEIIGESDALRYVLRKVEQVAPLGTTVLIEGETGVGKELFARAIHARSPRRDRPLIRVNCAALPANLIEAELFGHERGAFTGATRTRVGRFELAEGGTLFLDEVTELSLDLQGKLLRVLQEGEFERVGGDRTLKTDVRVIAATNRRLLDEVGSGRFREDLYYRLHVYPITVPALRQRREDIPLLARAFARRFAQAQGKRIEHIPAAVIDELARHDWPGNVRELQNVIEQAVIGARDETLRLVERLGGATGTGRDDSASPYRGTLPEVERAYMADVLELAGWRIEGPKGAAELLGLHPNTLRFRMRKLGITRPGAARR